MLYLDELEKLNLPKSKYVIVGSGPLAIRGIRSNSDIDLLLTKDLWERLVRSRRFKKTRGKEELRLSEHVFAYYKWKRAREFSNRMIFNAEFIQGFPFVKLSYLVNYKKAYMRSKDKDDLSSILSYVFAHLVFENLRMHYTISPKVLGMAPLYVVTCTS